MMHTPNVRCRAVLPGIALMILSAVGLKAGIYAYAGLGHGEFGTIDLSTGGFSLLGNMGQTPAGFGVADGELFAGSYGNGTLYQVNRANGSLTQIGSPSGIIYTGGFGSEMGDLYALAGLSDLELYSINPLTGAATPIGLTGISLGAYGKGADLYTLNTSTGAGTLVGPFGSRAKMGPLVTVGGVLYGGDQGNASIDTISTRSGVATVLPGTPVSDIWGLAPDPLTATTPEPGSYSYAALALGLGGIMLLIRSRSVRRRG
jgi:hypothetical protein